MPDKNTHVEEDFDPNDVRIIPCLDGDIVLRPVMIGRTKVYKAKVPYAEEFRPKPAAPPKKGS